MPEHTKIEYIATPTAMAFHASTAFFRGIRGPIGSGKSSMCVWELFLKARNQRVYKGKRRSRFAVIRNTYPELRDTTLNTFCSWLPEIDAPGYSFRINRQPPMHGNLRMKLADGSQVESEFIFLALDADEDVRKLKSLELTGAWINEASEINFPIFKMTCGRVRRFPAPREGGYSWSGVIADTNPPDDESWWYELAEVKKQPEYVFFRQPPAILKVPAKSDKEAPSYVPNQGQGPYPPAENVKGQGAGYNYWLDLTAGADPEWIKVFLMGEYGSTMQGKPVYPEYNDEIHCAKMNLEFYMGLPVFMGWDFGLTPCVLFAQVSPQGVLRPTEEICAEDMGIRQFARNIVKPYISNTLQGIPQFYSVGDPAGNQRGQMNDEITCLNELLNAGIPTEMAITNNFLTRREAVAGFLTRMAGGKPAFQMSPKCKVLRKGFMSNYRYRKMRTTLGERYTDEPEKNHPYSDIHDSLHYIAMMVDGGAGGTTARRSGGGTSPRRNVVRKSAAGWT